MAAAACRRPEGESTRAGRRAVAAAGASVASVALVASGFAHVERFAPFADDRRATAMFPTRPGR
ncbi:hypothetical protein DIE15_19855 [Burkholderia sp. Bp9031]|nr:hypothetical protein DIE15_19855 [Burkholderia sp. Bp9031]